MVLVVEGARVCVDTVLMYKYKKRERTGTRVVYCTSVIGHYTHTHTHTHTQRERGQKDEERERDSTFPNCELPKLIR